MIYGTEQCLAFVDESNTLCVHTVYVHILPTSDIFAPIHVIYTPGLETFTFYEPHSKETYYYNADGKCMANVRNTSYPSCQLSELSRRDYFRLINRFRGVTPTLLTEYDQQKHDSIDTLAWRLFMEARARFGQLVKK